MLDVFLAFGQFERFGTFWTVFEAFLIVFERTVLIRPRPVLNSLVSGVGTGISTLDTTPGEKV